MTTRWIVSNTASLAPAEPGTVQTRQCGPVPAMDHGAIMTLWRRRAKRQRRRPADQAVPQGGPVTDPKGARRFCLRDPAGPPLIVLSPVAHNAAT